MLTFVDILTVILSFVLGAIVLWGINWRWTLTCLGMIYGLVFYLVSVSWGIGLAAVKPVTGWMALAILGSSPLITTTWQNNEAVSKKIFRLAGFFIVAFIVVSSTQETSLWIPVRGSILMSSLILLGAGIVQLGLTNHAFQIVIGLLLTLTGFEILYAAVVSSVLVAGLLVLVNLGIAFCGLYLLAAPEMGGES